MSSLRELVAKMLREIADRIGQDNSELTESQAMDLLSMLTHTPMSKAQACEYLNISRSRFDDLVREETSQGQKECRLQGNLFLS